MNFLLWTNYATKVHSQCRTLPTISNPDKINIFFSCVWSAAPQKMKTTTANSRYRMENMRSNAWNAVDFYFIAHITKQKKLIALVQKELKTNTMEHKYIIAQRRKDQSKNWTRRARRVWHTSQFQRNEWDGKNNIYHKKIQ